MDRNLYTDDFERLLKEKSDEFRMYPSKRIWYSIYNNIHPGRKWPSVAMSIMLISTLMLVGYLNTNNHLDTSPASFSTKIPVTTHLTYSNAQTPPGYPQPFTQYAIGQSNTTINTGSTISPVLKDITGSAPVFAGTAVSGVTAINMGKVTSNTKSIPTASERNTSKIKVTGQGNQTAALALQKINVSDIQPGTGTISPAEAILSVDEPFTNLEITGMHRISNSIAGIALHADLLNTVDNNRNPGSVNEFNPPKKTNASKKSILSKEDQEWIEHYALYNRPVPKKWIGKLAWEVYATPSIVYRTLDTDYGFGITSTSAPFVIPSNNREINTEVNNKPSLGLEAGIGIQYPIFKGVKIKTGLQLNFTRYNANAYHNTHPVSTKLTMHDYTANSTYEIFRTTPYSNKTGLDAVKLHNETFQVSLPVGIDLKLLGNENLQWNVGATIQPTYLLGGKSYLISSDRRNYVKENSMLNRWNLNAGFETFVTYKRNGITYHIGPQFRRQLFSTNSKRFAIEERLVNYGIKFGVVKLLK